MDEHGLARSRASILVVCATLALALVGCGASVPSPTPTSNRTTSPAVTSSPETTAPADAAAVFPVGEPREIATGLSAPWSIVFVGDSALVSERDSGRILELPAGGGVREVGVVEGVQARGEGGLLGLAVDQDRRLYAYSTGGQGNRIQRFALTGTGGSFALGAAETILDGLPSAGNHNGGRIAFGPDDMLYAGVGDAGSPQNAQDPGSLGGKILRMTPDGGIPSDNPDPASLVYSSGHRNVQGLGWAQDGSMYASEFGQDTWDELNVIVAGGNYGWPDAEGTAGAAGLIDPVLQWRPDEASPSGIAMVAGSVVIANLRGERLTVVPIGDPSTGTASYAGEYGRIRDAVLAPDGTLWFVTNNTDGRGDAREGDDRIQSVELAG
ncbi:MAG: PQQ-dependent sugar dehydrogenase [Microbacterium pygmaeum]